MLRALVERWMPRRDGARDAWRVRFIHGVHLIGASVGTVMAGLYLLFGMRASAALTLTLALWLGGMLGALRRGADPTRSTRLSLLVALVSFAGYVVTERPFDPVMFLWFGLVPYLATTMLGAREAPAWMGGTVAVAVVARLLVAFEAWPPVDVQEGGLASNFRAISFAFTLFLFILQFESERQRSLSAVEEAARLKSRFLANMSHEIRTPMNGILGLTEALLHATRDPAQRESLEVIGRSGRTLVALLNDLLDVSKVEAGKLVLDRRPLEVPAMVRDLTALFTPLAGQKQLTLTMTLDDATPRWVEGDALRLRQVLSNLLGNALKFTASGSVVLAVAPAGEGRLRFSVKDTGIGIPAEVVPRLFARFEQADSSTTRQYGGSGLGLALSSELVALMGGRLEVSTAPREGSTFFFTIPAPPVAPPSEPEALVMPPTLPARSLLPVLVVDDNAVNRLVAVRLLGTLGVEAEEATNGHEAVTRAARGGLQLILMDCHMPEMDGYEATRWIRTLPGANARVPIVALTASVMPEELAACRAAGMDDTLTKPLNVTALGAILSRTRAPAAAPD